MRVAPRVLAYAGVFLACGMPFSADAQLRLTVYPQQKAPVIDSQSADEQSVSEVPGDASVIDQTQWSDERDENVKDITDYAPGVIAQPRDGAESDRLSVRGSGLANVFQGSGLRVLEDGIPLNMADGEFEFPAINPWLVRYADIYPGANALQYGASSFGGAINLITRNGVSDDGYDIRGEAGSFDTIHGMASMGKEWKGGDLFASADGFAQGGYRQQNEQDTSRFNGNLGFALGNDFSNRVYVSYTHSDADIPGAVSLASLAENPRLANPTNLAENYQRDLEITRVADKSAWKDGDNRIDTTVFYTYRTLVTPVTTYELQNTNDVGVSAQYTHQMGLGKWLIGLNNYYGFGDETRYKDVDATPGAHIVSRDLAALTTEGYTEYEQRLMGRLFGVADAQLSYDTRDIGQSFPKPARQDERFAGFNPRVGLRYDLADETQFFTNLSRSFEPPTWNELVGNAPGFTPLKAQHATTAEAGARWVTGNVHWQMAYYHGWIRDELVNYQFAAGNTATINANRSRRDGIEFGANGDILKNLWKQEDALVLRAAYTFSHFNLDHDPIYGNNTVPGVPEHYVRAEMLYRHPSGISIGPNVEWSVTASPVDLANTLYAPSYALMGFRTFWESRDQRLNFYVEGRNLLNSSYVATYNVVPNAAGRDGADFYPGEGRAVYAGFHLKL